MPIIFLSSRRCSNQSITHKIHEHLEAVYGKDAVFLDAKSIPTGKHIRHYIRDCLSQCALALPVIAAEWLNSITTPGLNSGDWNKPIDWVRIELEEALACSNVRVVPLLIDGVVIPREDMLPAGLKELPHHNGLCISSNAFHEDKQRLVRELNRLITGSALELPKTLASSSDDELLRQNQYRHEVRYCLENNDGQIDAIGSIYLEALRQHLQLTRESAKSIQVTVQQPYHRYTTAVRHLVDYQARALVSASQASDRASVLTLDERAISHLRRLHHNLDLPRWKALKLEHQIIKEWEEQYGTLPNQSA